MDSLLPDADAGLLDACARVALQPGLFDKLDGDAPLRGSDADPDQPASLGRHSVALDGFNLHAAVTVGADDDIARERLARYCARPPFALERLSQLPDGRIAYRIKQPRRNATHRILEPIELLARIAALIPPPRHPFLRYHGVLAPASKWRRWIVPRLEEQDQTVTSRAHTSAAPPALTASAAPRELPSTSGPPTPIQPVAPRTGSPVRTDQAIRPSPSRGAYARITAAHPERLGEGDT